MGEIAPGSVFAGHRIEAVAGRGGMGIVYRARQLSLDRTVALKVIAPALMQDPEMRRRFVRESRVAASIDHPHVIPVYYTGEEDGVGYIAMRFVAGDDVRTLVRREGPLGLERAVRIGGQVASALDAAHAAGLVHRDVKPANVLLGQEDHVYLTDFGLTKHVLSEPGAGVTREGHWVGTLDFVAPEQIRGQRVDARSDVYSLGCLLFYMLAGRPPFPRDTDEAKLWAHLTEPAPKASEAAPDVPQAVDGVIARALAKTPEERYPSAGDLGRAAAAAQSGDRPAHRERTVAVGAAAPVEVETLTGGTWLAPPSRVGSRRRPRAAAAAAGVLVLALVTATTILATRDSGVDHPPAAQPTRTPTPTPPRSLASARIGGQVNTVAGAAGRIWAGSYRHTKLYAIDAKSVDRKGSVPIGIGLLGIAVTGDTMWVIVAPAHQLLHLDARTGRRIGQAILLPGFPAAVAADRRSVWVALSLPGVVTSDELYAFDRKTGAQRFTRTVPDGVKRLQIYRGALWMLSSAPARIARLDLRTGKLRRAPLRGETSIDLTAGAGAVWATLTDGDRLIRIDPKSLRITPYAVGRSPSGVLVRGGSVWVANFVASTVSEIDPRTGRTRRELSVPLNPYELTLYRNRIWVTSFEQGLVTRLTTPDLGG